MTMTDKPTSNRKPIRIITVILFILLSGIFPVNKAFSQDKPELPIGDQAPLLDQSLTTIENETVTLREIAGENGLMVVFTSNTCPWVHRWESRYLEVASLAQENGITMIALNPNEATRGEGESLADMKKRAQDYSYNFIYAMDKDHLLATEYGANRTPHVYLFNADFTLVYRGAIDDNAHDIDEVEQTFAKDAILQLASGREIATKTSPSLGCTIKWLSE